MPSYFVSLFSVDWFNSYLNFAAVLFVEFIFGCLIYRDFNNIYNLVFFIACVQIFCSFDYDCFICRFIL